MRLRGWWYLTSACRARQASSSEPKEANGLLHEQRQMQFAVSCDSAVINQQTCLITRFQRYGVDNHHSERIVVIYGSSRQYQSTKSKMFAY